MDEDSVSLLHRKADWFKRGAADAVQIQRKAPTLNRGRERHILPAIYEEPLPLCAPRAGSLDPHGSVHE